MTRADHVSGTDRIAEVVSQLPCRAVVNVQGDEPLIEPDTIDAAIAPLLGDSSVEMSTLSRPFQSLEEFKSPHVVKVVTDLAGDALYFSRAPIPASAPSAARRIVRAGRLRARMSGLYVYRRETLLKLASAPRPRSSSRNRSSSSAPSRTASAFAWSRRGIPRPASTPLKISNVFVN